MEGGNGAAGAGAGQLLLFCDRLPPPPPSPLHPAEQASSLPHCFSLFPTFHSFPFFLLSSFTLSLALSFTVSLSPSFHSFPFFLLSSFTLSLALSFTVSLSPSFPFILSLSSSFHCFSSSLSHYRCLQAEDSERLQLEYTQQLLLGTLLSICDHLTSLGLEEARGTCTCTAQL